MMKHFIFPGPGTDFSYHNHSHWSDGGSSVEEMCRAAKNAGLKEFGVSDHYVIHPDNDMMPLNWAMPPEKLDAYISEIQRCKNELDDEDFCIKIGLEVDFFFENHLSVLDDLKKYPLDYLIGSVHFCGRFSVDSYITDWQGLSEEEIENICYQYWEKMLGAAKCKDFLFLGHLDLPKKFGFLKDPAKYLPEARKVLDAAASSGIGIELNTSGWFKECREQYPSADILREAKQRRIPVIVNPDAHSAAHVSRNFSNAAELLNNL